MIDSGSAVTYLADLQRRFPSAIYVYNAADSLQAVGAPDYLLPLENAAILNCDVVRSPSALLAKRFAAGANVHVVPHGIDTEPFDTCRTSPYAANTINVVSVGSTLLDDDVIRTIARKRPDILVHVFGLSAIKDMPGNVLFYGEVSFRETVPYIKYAHVGLAAYRLDAESAYIAESSLKMMQYRYCAIPIMVPDVVPSSGGVATYRTGEPESIVAALGAALRMTNSLEPAQVLTWRGVSAKLLEIIAGL
jgi:2-beta-glucuronyltransferase